MIQGNDKKSSHIMQIQTRGSKTWKRGKSLGIRNDFLGTRLGGV